MNPINVPLNNDDQIRIMPNFFRSQMSAIPNPKTKPISIESMVIRRERFEEIGKMAMEDRLFSSTVVNELMDTIANSFRVVLADRGWTEQACDYWLCPQTGCKHGLLDAARICGLVA